MASKHHNEDIDLQGIIKYADPLSTGSYSASVPNHEEKMRELQMDRYEDQGTIGPVPENWEEYEKNIFGKHVPPVTEEDLLSLVMGTTGGGVKNLIKSGKNIVKSFPKARRVDAGVKGRDVVSVEMMDEAGKVFKQPFYRSSGTSKGLGEASARKGVWEPFLGRGGGGYKTDQYAKGYFTKSDDMKYIYDRNVKDLIAKGIDPTKADLSARLGPFNKVSSEISRLDKLGYYDKSLYHNIKGPEKLNKFLTEQGVKLPFSAGK